MKKHLTWFPFLVIALTVLLAVTIVVYDRQRNQPSPTVLINDVLLLDDDADNVDVEKYYEDVRRSLVPIWEIVDGQGGDNGVIVNARNSLLEMRVPLGDRDVHIQLVAALNTLEAGLRGDEEAFADAQIRFSDIKSKSVWIQ